MKNRLAVAHPSPNPVRPARGFTLIELMITVAVIGILAAIAYPSYLQYVIRGNRGAAEAQMMDIASREQQLLLANRGYAAKADAAWTQTGYKLPKELDDSPTTPPKYGYDITVDNTTSPPTFTITFTAMNSQLSDGDLSLDSMGNKLPAAKW